MRSIRLSTIWILDQSSTTRVFGGHQRHDEMQLLLSQLHTLCILFWFQFSVKALQGSRDADEPWIRDGLELGHIGMIGWNIGHNFL